MTLLRREVPKERLREFPTLVETNHAKHFEFELLSCFGKIISQLDIVMNRSKSFANCGFCHKVGESEPFYNGRNRRPRKIQKVEDNRSTNYNLGHDDKLDNADVVAENLLQR